MTLAAGFVRVSTNSQDEASQVKVITDEAGQRGITIVRWFKLHGYSASHGTQEPALREAIADMQRGDYSTLVVTESSRLDRREDLDAQAEILLAIRSAGGDIISLAEPQFGKTDFAGRIVTLVAQHANAEKSRTVKTQTYRGISKIRDNKASLGHLPVFWEAQGARYSKQAVCLNPEAVKDVYERVAAHEPLSRIGRSHGDLYPNSIKRLIRFAANHTGVIECSWTHDGKTETWLHETTPVIDSALWWEANKALDHRKADRGGRVVAKLENWIQGVLDCPACGGRIILNTGGRVQTLRCGGTGKNRITCGNFKPIEAELVIRPLEEIFTGNSMPVLAYQRVSGNQHELDALKAELQRMEAQSLASLPRTERAAFLDTLEALESRIEGFQLIPDTFKHTETGRTIAQIWEAADGAARRDMVRAVKRTGRIVLVPQDDNTWGVRVDLVTRSAGNPVIDLGGGLCIRGTDTSVIASLVEGMAA